MLSNFYPIYLKCKFLFHLLFYRNSFNHNKHRRYAHDGGGSGGMYNEKNGYISQRNGHHSGNNMQQSNNNYGLNDGSGTIITGYSGSGMEPVDENITYGQYTVGQLQIELSEEHIDSNGRLELTCLATIPAYVEAGEQYADYKTSLRNGKSIITFIVNITILCNVCCV